MRASQSQLTEWEKCRRRHCWKYVLELEGKMPGLRATSGKAVHAALAIGYKGGTKGDMISAFQQEMAVLEPFVAQGKMDEGEVRKEKEVWGEIVGGYRDRYKHEEWEVIMVPELPIVATLGDGPHEVEAILDLVVKMKDGLWIVDHKTAGKTGPSWWTQFFVDKQGSLYVYAGEKVLNMPVNGWIINSMKPVKAFEDRYERQAFARTRAQLRSFERQTIKEIEEIEEAKMMAKATRVGAETLDQESTQAALDLWFPQFTHECHGFGTCQFLALCQVGKAALPVYQKRQKNEGGNSSSNSAAA